MFAIFSSQCRGKSIKRTRKILDAYASRVGQFTWQTPITEKGLQEIYRQLRKSASKSTAVSCLINQGSKGLKLAWTVGKKGVFDQYGRVAIGTKKAKKEVPEWVSILSLAVKSAGLVHDLGKTTRYFQHKLRENQISKDPIRHEWMSLMLMQNIADQVTLEQAYNRLPAVIGKRQEPSWFKKGIQSSDELIEFFVATHHGLLAPIDPGIQFPSASESHIRENSERAQKAHKRLFTADSGLEPVISRFVKTRQRLAERLKNKKVSDLDHYYRALAIIGRVALIYADHKVSAQKPGLAVSEKEFWAKSKGPQIQSLDWHLKEVAFNAANNVYHLSRLSSQLDHLTPIAQSKILKPAPSNTAFSWQNPASHFLENLGQAIEKHTPVLVMNTAETGTGKTLGNVKALCALNQGKGMGCRISIGLNLRSLTLQTGHAISGMTGINESEMAVIIGDDDYADLQKKSDDTFNDEDENPVEVTDDVRGGEGFDLPEWLSFIAKDKKQASLHGAPLLVSTIDYLVASGEPYQQGRHVSAFIRIAGSDLILDEIDGYEPKALIAVCRVIQMASLMGRNVVCSSATLSRPVANTVYAAFKKGVLMRQAMTGQKIDLTVAMIDNRLEPRLLPLKKDAFPDLYENYLKHFLSKIPAPNKKPMLVDMKKSAQGFLDAIDTAVEALHSNQCHEVAGKKLSVGLVRIANVKPAIKVARMLAKNNKNSLVACYHANDFVINRYHKEQVLDEILTRKGKEPNQKLHENTVIKSLLAQTEHDHVRLIVVATPVEEIGRDHDFDWAVIEPSSTSSIIQTAGRVNRHRNVLTEKANIGILRFNYATCVNRSEVFVMPGLEQEGSHPNHDLLEILNWKKLDCISTRMRFDQSHKFSKYDDWSIERTTNPHLSKGVFSDKTPYMTQGAYKAAKLREQNEKVRYRLDENAVWLQWRIVDNKFGKPYFGWQKDAASQPAEVIEKTSNDWLSLSFSQMKDLCAELDVPLEYGLSIELAEYNPTDEIVFDESFGCFRRRVGEAE
ncbi:P-loop NTPase family protein [Hydrogenovibrio halophilus]|uniref:hypothetical protein n=1 Tax=Hydrogenovibrio halophilus TaxID=373391 RepID=UPI00036CABA1|nr:hypothetical protein [Hydrogenovibrio halophilus]